MMLDRRWLTGLAAIAALALYPADPAVGQESLSVEVQQETGSNAGVDVFAVINAGKRRVGTTGEDGRTDVETGDIAVGTPVQVYVYRCGTRSEVVLVPEGEEAPEPAEDCERLAAGVFPWGQTGAIQVATTGSGATMTSSAGTAGGSAGAGGGATAPGSGSGGFFDFGSHRLLDGDLTLGASLDLSLFERWEEVGCNQPGLIDCSGGEWTPGLSLYGEFAPAWAPQNTFLGLRFSYFGSQDLHQEYEPMGSGYPTMQDFSVGGRSLDLYGGYDVYRGSLFGYPMGFGLFGGPSLMWNNADVESDLRETFERSQSGFKFGYGFRGSMFFGDDFGVSARYTRRTSFDDNDADRHHQLSIGGLYRPLALIPR